MAVSYPQSCYAGLLGVAGACAVPTITPRMNLNDIPGITLDSLSKLSTIDSPSGELQGIALIESASRLVAADVLAIYDAAYKVVPSLVNGCSACSLTTTSASGDRLGVMIKNQNSSRMARLILQNLIVKINADGEYNIKITDGVTEQTITDTFTSGQEVEFKNINYSTRLKEIRVYVNESVSLPRLSCPAGSGCGCSGKVAHQSDLVFTGTAAGVAASQAYGFIPCAYIGCDPDDILCSLAQQAPIMMAQALLYKTGELFFQTQRMSSRNNAMKSQNPEDVYRDERYWGKMYADKRDGKGTRGLRDVVNDLLQQSPDACITCDAKWQTAFATG